MEWVYLHNVHELCNVANRDLLLGCWFRILFEQVLPQVLPLLDRKRRWWVLARVHLARSLPAKLLR